MRTLNIDKATRQIISVGFSEPQDAREELVSFAGPLPQDADPAVNIQEYRLEADNITLTYNPAGDLGKERRKEAALNQPALKALVDELTARFPALADLRDAIKARL